MTGSGRTGDTPILSAAMAKILQSAGGEAQLEGCNAIYQRFAPRDSMVHSQRDASERQR